MESFILPANGKSTPDSIARKRKMAEAMLASGMDASPIASPWQGAARMAQALVGGLGSRRADTMETEGQQSAKDAMIKALTGGGKADLIDAASNPFMSNAGMSMVGNQWEKMNAPPPNPELKDMGNGQFFQYDPRDPQGSGQSFTPDGYQAPPGTRLITGEEATKMGLPPGAYNLDAGGKISQIGGNDTNVNINNADPNQPMMGTIPPGYAAVRDPASPSGFRLEAIGGGPAAADQQKVSDVNTALENKKMTMTDTIVGAASKARNLIGQTTTGIGGQILSNIGQTDAGELYRQTAVLKSTATIENLNAMRRESPTGGALGNVTEKEGAMLAAAAGALDPAAGPERYKQELDNYELTLLRIVHGYENGNKIFQQTREAPTDQGGMPDQGGNSELEDALKKYGQ